MPSRYRSCFRERMEVRERKEVMNSCMYKDRIAQTDKKNEINMLLWDELDRRYRYQDRISHVHHELQILPLTLDGFDHFPTDLQTPIFND